MILAIRQWIVISLVVVCTVGSVHCVFAAPGPADDSNAVPVPSFPYVAQITADNVNVRSGPGTHYYGCGKLKKNDKVTVVGRYYSWSQIVPPPGSFSWISKRYVKISADNAKVGVVDSDAVRVYVGTEQLDPIRSTRTQFKLGKGDTVQLLGELRSDYYKIAPPTGAYRWVTTKYTQPVVSKVIVPPPPPPAPVPSPPEVNTPVVPPSPAPPPAPVPAPPTVPVPAPSPGEPTPLERFQELKKQIDAERVKPISEQNYDEIEKGLLALAADEETGKAARYAKHALKMVERYQLVLDVTQADHLGDKQLTQIRKTISQARQARLAEVEKVGKYAATGTFEISRIYGISSQTKYYRIIGEDKRIVCYAVPDTAIDPSSFVGKKVGLVGDIQPHPQTVGALVRFTQIVLLD